MMLWLLLAIGVLAAVIFGLEIRKVLEAGQPLTREETERLRTAAHEALQQIEARRSTLVILTMDKLGSHLVSKN
jgi:hypothetical protein